MFISVPFIDVCFSVYFVEISNNQIVNIELTKIKVTGRINLKWPNLNYPSFYLVGRHLTFPVTTKIYIPWVEFVFPTLKFGWLQQVLAPNCEAR
jgi:hypothetical protein